MYLETSEKLLTFLDNSPSCFHAVDNIKHFLISSGYTALREDEKWEIKNGGKYFVTRNDSSLIAFTIPEVGIDAFNITATHSDWPTFKIKENPENCDDKYARLNVEPYGGGIYSTWLDRPLSVAGRVLFKENGKYVTKLVYVDRDLLMIPSLAIHMNRKANEGYKLDLKKDLLPIFGSAEADDLFMEQIAESAGVNKNDILGHDLFLCERTGSRVWGVCDEFISSGRIDNLQCTFATLMGFIMAKKEQSGAMFCVFDNEEVGSSTKQGADSTFLQTVLERIAFSLGMTDEDFKIAIAKSFMVSADNAHAYHPAHGEVADGKNSPLINGGVVIKFNANQKYCTDGVSAAIFKDICNEAEVPYQIYTNPADMPGGSTLGNISNTHISLNTVDVGLPQLAMHSAYETAGIKDTVYMIKAISKFFK